MADAARPLNDLLSRFGQPRAKESGETPPAALPEPVVETTYASKALQKLVTALAARPNPLVVDLGPVVGSNVTFFAEQIGCRVRVEDIAADLDSHAREGTLDHLPAFFASHFTQAPGTVDGIICWDLLDYLERPAAQALGTALSRLLKPDGRLLGFFSTTDAGEASYTKYIVVDASTLRYRPYPARLRRQRGLFTGDIIKLFTDLRVTDSFLMKTNVREMLFRKPAGRV